MNAHVLRKNLLNSIKETTEATERLKRQGLKKGGVLNIVRRKVELNCPADNIPAELRVDLEQKEIGDSIKISAIKLPEKVKPTILDRDFTIASVAAPTVVAEPETTAEKTDEEAHALLKAFGMPFAKP